MVKNLPVSAGDIRDAGSIPGWGRSPGGGHGHPLQYSRLENPMDLGARRATAHGVSESDMTEGIKHTHSHTLSHTHAHSHTHTHSHSLSLQPMGSQSQTRLRGLNTHTLTHTHTHTHTLSLTHTLTHTLSHYNPWGLRVRHS